MQEGHVGKVRISIYLCAFSNTSALSMLRMRTNRACSVQARERYESDCLKLNSYTANASLVQGKELEKLQTKLDRVRQTIGANEQDFKSFVRVLEGTWQKWEGEWKGFCDVGVSPSF